MNATRLPYHVSLLPGEALCSWIWRLAARFEISALHLLKGAFGVRHIDKESARHGTWWRTPERSLLDQISARTGMTTARLAKATLANWSPGAPGGEGGWGPEGRKFLGAAMARISDLIAACPRCLAENGSAYLRTTWIFQWLSCCPKHGIIMVCGCASCLARLSLPPLSSTRPWRPSCCRACGWSILDAETTPAQDSVRALQRRLLAGKRSGWIALPGFPPMPWPPFVAGLNAIAEVIWVHGKPGCRDELFALVAKEVGIEAVTPEGPPRKVGHGRVRHDAMLVLAWLLERWPDRLMTLQRFSGLRDDGGGSIAAVLSPSGSPCELSRGPSHMTCSGEPMAGRRHTPMRGIIRASCPPPPACSWLATRTLGARSAMAGSAAG
jgi:TniQ